MVLDFVALSGLGRHVENVLEKVLLGLHFPSRHLPLDTSPAGLNLESSGGAANGTGGRAKLISDLSSVEALGIFASR